MGVQVLIPIMSILCTILATIIGFLTLNRSRNNDVRHDASKNAVIETKLDNISQSVNSIVIDLKASELRWTITDKEVARIDESVKSAHKRLDKLENKGDA